MLISPVITFAVFAALSRKPGDALDTAKMFTSLSLVSLLTAPLSVVFQSIPTFMAAVGCFQRIQKYLLTDTKSDHRLRIRDFKDAESSLKLSGIEEESIEFQNMKPMAESSAHQLQKMDAIVVRNGSFGWKESHEPILRDISLTIKESDLTMIIGPVACGKSTLLKAILGETPSSTGFVYVSSTEVAFCDQTPWLVNGTVQKNILGYSNFDGLWYNSVIHACGSEEDIANLPGDQSLIGSKGIMLSGGQKQRIVRDLFHLRVKKLILSRPLLVLFTRKPNSSS
jgi:ATP-binding cassette subfamily C (CFTR/MRP) protein 1